MNKKLLMVPIALGVTLMLGGAGGDSGCSPRVQPPSSVELQRRAAVARVASVQTECNECSNIEFKREVLGKPGLIGYVAFLSDDGRPIQYYTVKGKCTSGKKRLTQPKIVAWIPAVGTDYDGNAASNGGSWEVVDGPSEDATFGDSGDYIYCRTTSDTYVQWPGLYLYQTAPFDLTIKPLVVDLSGKEQGQ